MGNLSSHAALITNSLVMIVLAVVLFLLDKVFPLFHQGFFCDDETIMKPYVFHQAIPTSVLVAISVCLIVFVVFSCDLLNYCYWKGKNAVDEDLVQTKLCCITVSKWISRVVTRLCLIACGALITNVLTNIGKIMVGRLRPHFLAVCQPDYSKFNCSAGYITQNVCSGDPRKILEARKSFPSGHSSTSGFVVVLLALYIEYVLVTAQFYLLKPLAQLTLISLGLACSFTRISDYFHHWSDVLAGYIIGVALAYYTVFYLMNLPHEEKSIREARMNCMHDYRDLEIASVKDSSSPNYQTTQ